MKGGQSPECRILGSRVPKAMSTMDLFGSICTSKRTQTNGPTWTSKMAKIRDPVLLILSILGYRAIILGSFGGPGISQLREYRQYRVHYVGHCRGPGTSMIEMYLHPLE